MSGLRYATLVVERQEACQREDTSNGSPTDIDIKRDKQEVKATKSECLPKVDEYGRLVRQGSSDSNSDASRNTKRPKRSTTPSRNRPSRSPRWSTRNRRSRSRSPTFRDENKRQDRRNISECFDFRRGRCSRGGSCRYMHSEPDRNDVPFRHRNHQKHVQVQSRVRLHGEIEGQEIKNYPDMVSKDGQFDNTEINDQILSSADIMMSQGGLSQAIEQSQSNNSVGLAQKFDYPSRQIEASVVSDSPLDQASKTSLSKVSSIEAAAVSTQARPTGISNAQQLSSGQFSSQVLAPPLPSFSSANSPYPSQLLPPPPQSQGISVAHVPQLHINYSQRPPYQVQSMPTGLVHPYQGPSSNQLPQFSAQDSVRPFLSPPPLRPPYDPSLNAGTAAQGASSRFQQNHLAPRSDFGSQSSMSPCGFYPTESSNQMYPTLSEQPHPLQNRGDFESHNPSNPPFGGPGHMRQDRFSHAPEQNVNLSHSLTQGHLQPQPVVPPSQDLARIKMQNFSGDNFPSGELVNAPSQIHPQSHNQQPSYGFGDSMMGMPAGHQLPQVPDFGASRIQTHHNPYAATFDQPLSFKLNSNVQVPVDGQGVGSAGSRQTTSSPTSAGAAGQLLCTSVTKQYDPLFDSIDPSGNLLNKHDQSQKNTATNDSNMALRFSSYSVPLDVEGNKKHTEVDHVASATSLDNDGYGETADTEVGVVEDESLSTDDREEYRAAGEVEIDQVKSRGKSKKNKDSRSSRLFKSAVADFVKDLLKPSWRQGNMSKEAFKTIVKKSVDKVSGAMKSHQIPKSEAKINHYIDSCQRKLTKLVMGYVDKYVKV